MNNTDVHDWDSFVSKLARAKKEDKIKKISVPSILRLIMCGAFDGLAMQKRQKYNSNLPMYMDMFAEVCKVLKSKAALPKKGKNDLIGLDKVKNDIQLSLYRWTLNPSGSYPFIHSLKDKLSVLGFNYDDVRGRYTKLSGDKTKMMIATDDWKRIFTFHGTQMWKDVEAGRLIFSIPGIITKANVLWNKERTKERMVVQIYTGKDNTEDLMIWPEYGKNTINPFLKEFIKPGSVWLLDVRPQIRDGKQGGTIKNAQEFRI
jgi:hypothetical protein